MTGQIKPQTATQKRGFNAAPARSRGMTGMSTEVETSVCNGFNAAPARSRGMTTLEWPTTHGHFGLQCGPRSLAGDDTDTAANIDTAIPLQCGPRSLAGDDGATRVESISPALASMRPPLARGG